MGRAVRITALDLAVLTGVCFGEFPAAPAFETWDLRERGRGQRGIILMRRLIAHIEAFRPQAVYIEQPLDAYMMARVGSTLDTQISLTGYVFLAETVCASRRIETALVDVQDARFHFIGVRRFGEKEQGKKAVFARCVQLGWRPGDLNQSDAGAIWDYGASRATSAYARLTGDRPARPEIVIPAKPKRTPRRDGAKSNWRGAGGRSGWRAVKRLPGI